MPNSPENKIFDFAIIGHQDSWESATSFVNHLRNPQKEPLSTEQVKDIFPYLPPCDIFRVNVKSKTGSEIKGIYIETFIDPDKLDEKNLRTNINKVKSAMEFANNKAKIISLGGFTSIVLEGNINMESKGLGTFSTGNTLTTAYIVKAVEKYFEQNFSKLKESKIMIIGASGDIGMGCVNYFKNKVKQLLLCARNKNKLDRLTQSLVSENISALSSTSPDSLCMEADAIICVASSSKIRLSNFKKGVLILDAGYPKNLAGGLENSIEKIILHGGMGRICYGLEYNPDYSASLYQNPVKDVVHGCILESMVLAFEKNYVSYSSGKGNITADRIEEIYQAGIKHGIVLSPFHNSRGIIN